MPLVDLLQRLDNVRGTGKNSWRACCPCHDSKSRSTLSIRELDDGRVLLHDFGGCEVKDVLAAVGLGFDALFPETSPGDKPRERRPFNPMQLLESVAFEALVVATAAENLIEGVTLTDEDRARIAEAASKLNRAWEVARGR